MAKGYICSCFFFKNIFIKRLKGHFDFIDRDDFLKTYKQILRKAGVNDEEGEESVIAEIQAEISRRKNLGKDQQDRTKFIAQNYRWKHPEIFTLKHEFLAPEFVSLIDYCKGMDATFEGACDRMTETHIERAYATPVFTAEFCHLFLEEVENFENSCCPKGRPNTMNNYGVNVDEMGFNPFMTELVQEYLQPVTNLLYPDSGGGKLDSHKAFVVQYCMGQDLDLSYHFDNAEITLNVALSPDEAYTGGNLYFGPMRTERTAQDRFKEYEHQQTVGLLHRGQHMHGARAIGAGSRYNLIIWMRSSKVRNQLCPMCDNAPDLVSTEGFGDGFTRTQDVVNVCCVE